MLYRWPALYIVSLVIITRPAVHTATWQLIKDTFNSPLLSLTNPNTNPYPNPNPNPAHTARRVHMSHSNICTCYIEHMSNFLNGSLFSCSVMVIILTIILFEQFN